MSTKAYDYFITDLSVFDAADRIRDTINPVFFDAHSVRNLLSLDARQSLSNAAGCPTPRTKRHERRCDTQRNRENPGNEVPC